MYHNLSDLTCVVFNIKDNTNSYHIAKLEFLITLILKKSRTEIILISMSYP